jgi:hypothetical protein
MPYREMEDRLGAEEREDAAVELLGRWRMSVRARVLAVASVSGVIAGLVGIYAMIQVQFAVSMRASVILAVIVGFAVPFVAAISAGMFVARRRIAARLDTKLTELADSYRIDIERLRHIADLVNRL